MIIIPETHRELLTAPVGMLATHGADGYPQVTAVWFLFDDDGQVKLSLNTARQKVKNLFAQPKCSFFILDPVNPYRTLEMRALALITPDADYAFAKKLGAKYGNDDFFLHDRPGEARLVVTLQPAKVNVWGR